MIERVTHCSATCFKVPPSALETRPRQSGQEETFHLRHGEQWMRRLNKDNSGHEELQKAVDWMFLLTVEWFGLPDDLKKHSEQLDYGFKGHSNDELRQIWMSTAVPFCNELQLKIPAHYDEEQKKYNR